MQNYVEKVLRTESLIPKIDCNPRLLHSFLGISTEIGEIVELQLSNNKQDKLIDEIGDCFWYIGLFFDIFSLDFDSILNNIILKVEEFKDGTSLLPNKFITDKLVVISSQLVDSLKKNIFYKKVFPNHLLIMEDLIKWLLILCNANNLSIDDILDKNIAKLKERFPDKFIAELAINKNDENERKVFRT